MKYSNRKTELSKTLQPSNEQLSTIRVARSSKLVFKTKSQNCLIMFSGRWLSKLLLLPGVPRQFKSRFGGRGFRFNLRTKKTNHSNIINVDKFHWKTEDLATLSTMNSQNTGAESQFRSCILRRSTLRYDKGCPNSITHLNAASKCVLHFLGNEGYK